MKIHFLIVCSSVVASTTDVCNQVMHGSDTILRSQHQTPYCDYTDTCVGLSHVDGGKPVSCAEAFRMVTLRNRVQNISEPPIVRICSEEDYHWILSDENAFIGSFFSQSESTLRMRLHPELLRLLSVVEASSGHLVQRLLQMSPRYIFVDEIDGSLLRDFTATVRAITRPKSPWESDLYFVANVVRRSESIRKLAWVVSLVFHQVSSAHASADDMEILLISIAPWVHAFMYASFHLNFLYPRMLQGNIWILEALSKYYPLYDTSQDVWYYFLNEASANVHTAFPFRPLEMTPDILLDEILFSIDGAVSADSQVTPPTPTKFLELLVLHMKKYSGLIDAEDEIDARRNSARQIQIIVQVLGYIQRSSNQRMALPRRIEWRDLITIQRFLEISHSDEEIPWLTISTLKKVIYPYYDSVMRFHALSGYDVINDRIPARRSNQAAMRRLAGSGSITDKILSLDRQDLSKDVLFLAPLGIVQLSQLSILDVMLRTFFPPMSDLLESVYLTEIGESSNTTKIQYYRVNVTHAESRKDEQIALGRLIGLAVESLTPGQILSKYLVGSPTILQTLFFNSYHVRAGFYQVITENAVEENFSSGFDFIEALNVVE